MADLSNLGKSSWATKSSAKTRPGASCKDTKAHLGAPMCSAASQLCSAWSVNVNFWNPLSFTKMVPNTALATYRKKHIETKTLKTANLTKSDHDLVS
jgi:hypothetical protein